MSDHYEQAVHGGKVAVQLLTEAVASEDDESVAAAVETASWTLMSASVHAALAQVDAIRELTETVKGLKR